MIYIDIRPTDMSGYIIEDYFAQALKFEEMIEELVQKFSSA